MGQVMDWKEFLEEEGRLREKWREFDDWDFAACLENTQQDFDPTTIFEYACLAEGENDEAAWHWKVCLQGGTIKYLVGGCDYTGWDCQAGSDWYTPDEYRKFLKLND